jgi:hypothetical protein
MPVRLIAGFAALVVVGFGISPARATTITDGGFTISGTTDENDDIVFTDNGNNDVNGATFNESVDLFSNSGAFAHLFSDSIFNGTTQMANGSEIALDPSATLNNSSTGLFEGAGDITQYGGSTFENDGTVNANVSGLTLDIQTSNYDNAANSLSEATNGATLLLNGEAITNEGAISAEDGTVELDGGSYVGSAGSTLNQTSGTIEDYGSALSGVIAVTGSTGLTFEDNGNDTITGATITGNLDFATAAAAYAHLFGSNTYGSGTATMAAGSQIVLDPNASLSVDTSAIIQGAVDITEDGGSTISNNGLINANSSGNTLEIQTSTLNNNTGGTLEATSGGELLLNTENITNDSAITAGAGSTVVFAGDTLTDSSSATLNQDTGGQLLDQGSALYGTIVVNGATGLTFEGNGNDTVNQGNVGTTSIVGNLDFASQANALAHLFGNVTYDVGASTASAITAASGAEIVLDPNATFTVGSEGTIQGGMNLTQYGASTVNNYGTFNSNENGTVFYVQNTEFNNEAGALSEATNGGTLQLGVINTTNDSNITANGGTVVLNGGTYTGDAGSHLNQTSGQLYDIGTQMYGTIAITGSTGLTLFNDGNDQFYSTAVTGNLDFATNASAFAHFLGTSTYDDGTANMATGAAINLDPSANLTIGSNATINGSGSFGEYGGATITNNGTVNADLSGQQFTVSGITDYENGATGVSKATNGGTLAFNSSNTSNAGAITANGGTVEFNAGTYTGTGNGTLNQTSGALEDQGTNFYGTVAITGSTGLTLYNNLGDQFFGTAVTGNLDFVTQSSAFAHFLNTSSYSNGTASMAGSSNIYLDPNATLNILTGGVIQGAGNISQYGGSTFSNGGTLDGNLVGQQLEVSGLSDYENTAIGVAEATNGGILNFNASNTTNAGAITANGGTVEFNGGTYTGTGNGTLNQTSGALEDQGTAFYGTVAITGSTGLTLYNNGGDQFFGTAVTGNLDFVTQSSAFAHFLNTSSYSNGTASMAGGSNLNLDPNATLNILTGGVIQGAGNISQYGGSTISNGGTFNANTSGQDLTVNVSNFSNSGTAEASNGGTLNINPSFTNTGTVYAHTGSTINVGGETQTAGQTKTDGNLDIAQGQGTLQINGGTLGGSGTVTGNVNIGSAGTVAPGDPQTLHISGNYDQTGSWTEDLASPTLFDTIDAGGTFALGPGSVINVDLLGGFAPTLNETFDIADYSSLLQNDSTVNGDFGWQYLFQDNGSGNVGELVVTQVGSYGTPTPEAGTYAIFGLMLAFGGLVALRRKSAKVA